MSTFHLRVIASNRVFYDGDCVEIVIPAIDGEMGILAHHERMVVAMTVGDMRFLVPDKDWQHAVVGIGFVNIEDNEVTVLADTVERPRRYRRAPGRSRPGAGRRTAAAKAQLVGIQHVESIPVPCVCPFERNVALWRRDFAPISGPKPGNHMLCKTPPFRGRFFYSMHLFLSTGIFW